MKEQYISINRKETKRNGVAYYTVSFTIDQSCVEDNDLIVQYALYENV